MTIGMPGCRASSRAARSELVRIQLEVEGEGELPEACEAPFPGRLVEEVSAARVAGPGGFMVQDLPDAAQARTLRQVAKNARQLGVFQRSGGDDDIVQGGRGELRGDPARLRDAGPREAWPVHIEVADAHRLDQRAAGELEALDRQVRLEARPVVDGVAVDDRVLTRVVTGDGVRRDVPEVKVRIPELHSLLPERVDSPCSGWLRRQKSPPQSRRGGKRSSGSRTTSLVNSSPRSVKRR